MFAAVYGCSRCLTAAWSEPPGRWLRGCIGESDHALTGNTSGSGISTVLHQDSAGATAAYGTFIGTRRAYCPSDCLCRHLMRSSTVCSIVRKRYRLAERHSPTLSRSLTLDPGLFTTFHVAHPANHLFFTIYTMSGRTSGTVPRVCGDTSGRPSRMQ